MYFELRRGTPLVSWRFRSLKKLFLKGQVREAARIAARMYEEAAVRKYHPNDLLLLADIAAAAGNYRRSAAIIVLGHRHYPSNDRLALLHIRHRCDRYGAQLQALKDLNALEARTRGSRRKRTVRAAMVRVNAQAGFSESALAIAEELQAQAGSRDALVWATLGQAAALLRDWERAKAFGEKAIAAAPKSLVTRLSYIENLLAKGEEENAERARLEARALPIEDYRFDYFLSYYAYFRGDLTTAVAELRRMQDAWRPDPKVGIGDALVHLLWFNGERAQALEMAKATSSPLDETLTNAHADLPRKLLSVPIMCQEASMCVPTSVAIVAGAQGVRLDPRELFRAMRGNDGTELWQMVDVMRGRGFDVQYVRNSPKAINGVLEQGVPLIGQLVGMFGSHVDVIIGFDESLSTWFIRDPDRLMPSIIGQEALATRYVAAGDYLIALVSPEHRKDFRLQTDWISESGNRHIELAKAVAGARLPNAIALYTQIDDDELSFAKYNLCYGITLTPSQYAQQMDALAGKESLDPALRFRALVSSAKAETIDKWIERAVGEQRYGRAFILYLRLVKARLGAQWEEALRLADQLLMRDAGNADLWTRKAEAELELGRLELARQSARRAEEISPRAISVKKRVEALHPYAESYSGRIAKIQRQRESYPTVYEVEQELAYAFEQGPDGFAYEAAMKRCIQKRPLLPGNYIALADWYQTQGRRDLAKATLARGRNLIGIQDLPLQRYEADPSDGVATAQDRQPVPSLRDRLAAMKSNWTNAIDISPADVTFLGTEFTASEEYRSLSWWEQVEFLAFRYALAENDSARNSSAPRPTELPATLPGTPPFSFLHFNRVLERFRLSEEKSFALYAREKEVLESIGWHADLQFDLGWFLEQAGRLSEARQHYEIVIRKAPGHTGAHYRIAVLLEQMQRYKEAIQQFDRALEISPSLDVARQRLINFYRANGKVDEALERLAQDTQRRPYDLGRMEDEIRTTRQLRGDDAGQAVLERYRERMTESQYHAVKARVYADAKKHADTERELALVSDSSDLERYCLIIRVDCAIGRDDWAGAETIVDQGLARYPRDAYILETKGHLLLKRDPKELLALCEKLFLDGYYPDKFLNHWVVELKAELPKRGFELLRRVEGDRRLSLARALNAAYRRNRCFDALVDHLEWCHLSLPNALDLHQELAFHYCTPRRYQKAMQIAERLMEVNPSGNYNLLFGYIYENVDLLDAIRYFEKERKISGSLDALVHTGMCYQRLNQKSAAQQIYHQVLEYNDHIVAAINNLIVLGEKPRRLYLNICKIIENGYGRDEYFAVSAVKSAVDAGRSIPARWIEIAEERFNELRSERPFRDEKILLARAIAQWHYARGDKKKAKQVLVLGGASEPFWRLKWPRRGWLPKNLQQLTSSESSLNLSPAPAAPNPWLS